MPIILPTRSGEYKCPNCKAAIEYGEKYCHNCGLEFSENDTKQMIEENKLLLKKNVLSLMFFAVIILTIFIAVTFIPTS